MKSDSCTGGYLAAPTDRDASTAYVSYLADRDPSRAEVVRILWELRHAKASERDELVEQLRRLLEQVDASWWDEIRPNVIRNCGRSEASGSVRFLFQCPNEWELLESGDRPNERFCRDCSSNAY